MNKRNFQVINIIENSIDYNNCMKLLNLEINSYFLCLLHILEDAILDYNMKYDYNYLTKTTLYFLKIYDKLSIKKRENYKQNIKFLLKIYKKNKDNFDKKDLVYFKNMYNNLYEIINKKEENNITEENDNIKLYELLYEVIFNFKNLDYLDKLIDNYKGILNIKEEKPIFFKVINEYIKQISVNNLEEIDYYERVINKFLLDETFDLNDEIKNSVFCMLNDFIKYKRNLNSKVLKRIKIIIEGINNKSNLFSLFNIPYSNAIIYEDEIEELNLKNNINNRVRIINEHIITIDEDNTRVLDDAISFKKLKNGNSIFRVHIADPLVLIPYYSNTYRDALKRGETFYNKNDTIDMLPSILSNDKLSLLAGKERFAKTFCYELDSDYNIVDFYILNTTIKVSDRLSYDYLNNLYKKGGKTKEEENELSYYNDVINSLKKIFSNVEKYHEEKERLGIHQSKNGNFSESLVSYSMILTGYMTSNYFNLNNLPYLYRCNNLNLDFINLLDRLIKENELKKLNIIKNNLPRSYYSKENVGHEGLNLTSYSHITSPLRRYADLLNMNILNICYFNKPNDIEIYDLENEIDLVSKYLNMQDNTYHDYLKKKIKKR